MWKKKRSIFKKRNMPQLDEGIMDAGQLLAEEKNTEADDAAFGHMEQKQPFFRNSKAAEKRAKAGA